MPFSSTARSVAEVPLRADLRPGPAVKYDDFCRTLFCPEAVLFCLQQRLKPRLTGVRQLDSQLQIRGAQGTQPAGILQTTAGRARRFGLQIGASPLRSSTRSSPASARGPAVFHQAQPAQSALSAAVGDGRRLCHYLSSSGQMGF